MNWFLWFSCGGMTFVVMWLIARREGRKFAFTDLESIYSVPFQIGASIVVFLLGPIGLALTLLELLDES